MELLKKILNSSLWLLIGNSVGRLAMFLASIFAARMLSQEAFGQFAMIRNTISSAEGLISGTLGSTSVKKIAQNQDNDEKLKKIIITIFFINISFLIIIILLIFINTEFIVKSFFLGEETLIKGLYLGLFILLTSSFSNLFQNILMGFERFKAIANLSILSSVISIPVIFFSIYFFDLYGALFSVAFYFLLDFIFKFFYFFKFFKNFNFQFTNIKSESKIIFIFVLPILLTFLVNGLSFWYARVLIVESSGRFNEIAIFDAAFQWLTIIMIITTASTNVVLPRLSKVKEKTQENTNLFLIGLCINIFISIFISFCFIFFAKDIMSIYGNEYIKGYPILEILCYVSIAFTISLFLNKYNISKNKSWILFIASLFGSLAMFSLIYFYMETLNIKILAWSFFVYYLITIIVYSWRIK